jgi:tetratricopeptide (TPR) repeat protein/predicted Ser/Thr protein kinase
LDAPAREAAVEAAPVQPMPAPGQLLAGRYTVLQLLGQGGMGVVLAAYDSTLDRRVALKLLQARFDDGPVHQARLLREAQAMARLSHPNVVAVYDAGQLADGRIFIAMEMVKGQTLRSWCKERPRAWHEVLEVFIAAGRGLSAAHESGLVHRDFKPDNVLVGDDGRVRVMDFGVARSDSTSADSDSSEAPTPPSALSGPDVWDTPLTLPGTVVGTPKYLAPELLRRSPADARSDLFAFCVALYEALYGQSPYPGTTRQERMWARLDGQVSPPPAKGGTPSWVTHVVLQGLRPEPSQRPPSMQVLLRALSRDRAPARTRWLALAASLVALLALAGGATAWNLRVAERAQLCQGGPLHLKGVWDADVQGRLQQAFVSTGKPFALDASTSVQKALGAYANDWVTQHREACEATRLRGEQSEDLLGRRMACLERRRRELGALGQVFVQADAAVVQQAVQAVQGLSPLASCSDVDALLAEVPPPSDPRTREAVEALRQELARGQALSLSGKYKDAMELTQALVSRARSVDYPPVLAEALLGLGRHGLYIHPGESVQVLAEAAHLANAHRQDRLAAEASISLVRALNTLNQDERAEWWLAHARSLLTRIHGDAVLEAQLECDQGVYQATRGRQALSLAAFERCHQMYERALGPEHMRTIGAEGNVALALSELGQVRQASQQLEQVAARFQSALGPRHPLVAVSWVNIADHKRQMGELDQALRLLERADDIQRETLPPVSMGGFMWHLKMSVLRTELGHHAEAVTQARVVVDMARRLDILERGQGGFLAHEQLALTLARVGQYREAWQVLRRALRISEHPQAPEAMRAFGWSAQAFLHDRQGRHGEAARLYERAYQHLVRLEGAEGRGTTFVRVDLAASLVGAGRYHEALELARVSQRLLEERLGARAPKLAQALQVQGEALLELGEPARAVPLLERALHIVELGGVDFNDRDRLRQLLARALAGPDGDSVRVVSTRR